MSVAMPTFTTSLVYCADAGRLHAAKRTAANQTTPRFIVSLPRPYSCVNTIKRRSMKEHILDIPTKDGAVETFVCYPERGGPYPLVLFLMDAPGIRGELYDMTRRLAT